MLSSSVNGIDNLNIRLESIMPIIHNINTNTNNYINKDLLLTPQHNRT